MKGTKESAPAYGKNAADQYTFDYQPIRGYPELRWTGKRPFKGTTYFPAQLKESHGDTVDGWRNKLYWGDNLQVMSHLMREYRGKIRLIYIDPPFDSKADYKKKIELRNTNITGDASAFEEKQYSDIWTNDEYLQFMYERLILIKELLADDGSVFVHCDYRQASCINLIMQDIFGPSNYVDNIVWCYEDIGARAVPYFKHKHDDILFYQKTKTREKCFTILRKGLAQSTIERYGSYFDENGQITYSWLKENNPGVFAKLKGIPENLDEPWLDKNNGSPYPDWWTDISPLKSHFDEAVGYPTQKPEALLERIIRTSSRVGDIVFDCFMGSGTTQAVAMKLGRRFLGADINLGAIQTTTKRLLGVATELYKGARELELEEQEEPNKFYTGFEVYTVNHYDFFRNELEAKELLIEALEIQELPGNMLWDGESDGWMVKILAVNRLATAADLNPILANLDYKTWEKRAKEHPEKPVESIRFVCMGHDPDLKAQFQNEMNKLGYKVDMEVLDILRDRQELQFKREAEAKITLTKRKLEIKKFYPMNLMQKLSLEKTKVGEWRELVDSVLIDWNYDGAVFSPTEIDIPGKKELVKGVYDIPEDVGTIRVKITDLLAESWEGDVGE